MSNKDKTEKKNETVVPSDITPIYQRMMAQCVETVVSIIYPQKEEKEQEEK